jgi:hypothetical protein
VSQFANVLVAILFGVFLVWGPVGRRVHAQAEKDDQQSPLIEGLLDLLGPPDVEEAGSPDARLPDGRLPNAAPNVTREGVGLDGEDLGEQADNPLASVRQSMLIAADYLRQGFANTETQQLQTDIVTRLDELIAEIETSQQESSSQSSQGQQASQSEPSQSESEQLAGQSSPEPSANSESEGDSQPQPSQGDSPQNNPGQQGGAKIATVDLADPQALQQSVWGQLPEQVRKQMQSRMVERFLPSYREQIEAYFQALLESQ